MSVVNTFYLYNGGSRPDDKLPILFHGNYLYLLSHSTSTLFQYLLQIYDITKPEEAYLASTMDLVKVIITGGRGFGSRRFHSLSERFCL